MNFLSSRFYKSILVVALTWLFCGCSSVMRGDVVTFYEDLLPMGETIRVEAMDPEKAQSLEFRNYARLIEEELSKIGYVPVQSSTADVDLIAEIDYSVERLDAEIRIERNRPFAHYHFYYGRYYDPFYFGVNSTWDDRVYTRTSYMRNLQLNIVRADEERSRIFEGRVESKGSQSRLPEIMPYLSTAMFSNFPGESGVTKVVTIEMDE